MKFLSLAQLFGERNSRSEVSRKRGGRGTGKNRRRGSLPLHLESLERRDLLTTVPLPTPLIDSHSALGVGVGAFGGTGGTSAPMTVINPVDPSKVVTVYVDNGL